MIVDIILIAAVIYLGWQNRRKSYQIQAAFDLANETQNYIPQVTNESIIFKTEFGNDFELEIKQMPDED